MKLYFTGDVKIEPEHSLMFNEIAVNIRKMFIDIIELISRHNKDSIDWWVSSPASRNIFASPLFHYCCCLALLQELIRTKYNFTEIVTDSKALKYIIEEYLDGQGIKSRVTLAELSVKQRVKELVLPSYVMFGIPMGHILQFFAAKLTKVLRTPLPSVPLTLIDTFVMPGYIEKDRYYTDLLDALSKEEKQVVWFVPHLHGFRLWQYLPVIRRLRKSERNFLLKDDFLKFSDYWHLWGHILKIRKLQVKPSSFQGIDISTLVREELTGFRGLSSSYAPFLNFYFVKRLKQADVKLQLVIDWFENQNIDKGWNAGFRRFFPDVETKGYQGFVVTKHLLSLYPSVEEKNSEVIPNKIFVIGRELVQAAKEFCPDLDVKVAPALRFHHVWLKRKYTPAANVYPILVALPIVIREAVYILKLLVPVANEMLDNTRFWIKPHPAISQSQIRGAFYSGWPERFEFLNGDFRDCVEKSYLLISNASSVCMETLAKGIPVIVIGNSHGLTHNPIRETITDDVWRLCNTPEEVTKAIQFYRGRSFEKIKEHEAACIRIREGYFEPVTRRGVRKFLGLSEGIEDA
ncbi:hypothetical protein C4565_06850 [Candidatus Parcubacteria bacterium]|nr:MAG: hypothetical protein C4565_06850 [Candidatus Parcubacteria bacterium]